MKFFMREIFVSAVILAFSGCVTSHYTNEKGCDCTRKYFTPFGISWKSCSKTPAVPVEPTKDPGEVLKVAPMAPSPSLRQSTPAKAIEQNIRSTTRIR